MIAYFDCFSGISGDMTLGAFIDLGVDSEWLRDVLSGLITEEFGISVSPVIRNGISAKKVEVTVGDAGRTSRDFSMVRSVIEESGLSGNVKDIYPMSLPCI